MAGFTLFGKVSLDNSGFAKALGGAKASIGPVTEGIGKQIRGKMLEAFSATGAVMLFSKSIQRALEIRSGSTKAGVDTSTFQAIEAVAKRAGVSVEDVTAAMAASGPAADELTAAVGAAKAEMEDTGRIISGDVVQRMAQLGDKLGDLFGRIQPGLVWFVDILTKLYDIVGRGVGAAVAGGQMVLGKLTGDSAMVQAGQESAREAFAPGGDSGQTSVSKAAELAAAAARAADKHDKAKKEKITKDAQLATSSLVQVGGILRPGSKTVTLQQQMADRLRDIHATISRFGRD